MRRYWLVFGVVAMVLGSGCQATGMGWIPSPLNPADKATFGFVYDGTTMTFSGSYHDPQGQTVSGVVDVAFKGTGVVRPCKAGDPACAKAPANAKGGCLAGVLPYQSQNPKLPGDGSFFLFVCDLDGNGASMDGDLIFLQVDTGPYAGYTNMGNPQGNITVKQ